MGTSAVEHLEVENPRLQQQGVSLPPSRSQSASEICSSFISNPTWRGSSIAKLRHSAIAVTDIACSRLLVPVIMKTAN